MNASASCRWLVISLLAVSAAIAQSPLEKRVADLERKLEAMGGDLETLQFGDVIPPIGESVFGLGPAGSKVYLVESGLSWGGYGEFLFTQRSGNTDVFDAQRIVNYIGYRFDENFVLNTEIELEHGSTSASSGTTTSSGSVSAEFAYLDYLHSDAFKVRAGLVLAPMGIVNELHEPTNFLAAGRSQTESRIIPTTWRALGAGLFGQAGGFEWRAYGINSLDGDEFSAAGLRGGRQKGNRVAADDFAVTARLDYSGWDGITLGTSVFHGKAGQDGLSDMGASIPGLDTTIFEAHAEVERGPFEARGVYAHATVDDAGAFNVATGERLASALQGYYLEAGVDVLSLFDCDTRARLTPYLRYEHIDTQARMPAGFAADPSRDNEIWTVGVQLKPIQNIVLKIDYSDWDGADDQFNVLLGYIF